MPEKVFIKKNAEYLAYLDINFLLLLGVTSMKNQMTILLLFLILFLFTKNINAQTFVLGKQPLLEFNSTNSYDLSILTDSLAGGISLEGKRQGTFFITPYFQYTNFQKLKLTSHSNHYKLYEGERSDVSPPSDIDKYNDNYDTEYENNMYGIKIGYQLLENIGVNVYAGFDNFNFKSWISHENNQSHRTDRPAMTFGLSLNYETFIYDKIMAMATTDFNYFTTNAASINSNSGEAITSVGFESVYWECNLVLGYPLGDFLPYAGVGYTELYLNAVHEEQILISAPNGEDFYNKTEFDSNFNGKAFYGFGGLQYNLSKRLSIYARSSFPNPLRANFGLIIKF